MTEGSKSADLLRKLFCDAAFGERDQARAIVNAQNSKFRETPLTAFPEMAVVDANGTVVDADVRIAQPRVRRNPDEYSDPAASPRTDTAISRAAAPEALSDRGVAERAVVSLERPSPEPVAALEPAPLERTSEPAPERSLNLFA